jgi:hypothetical protein
MSFLSELAWARVSNTCSEKDIDRYSFRVKGFQTFWSQSAVKIVFHTTILHTPNWNNAYLTFIMSNPGTLLIHSISVCSFFLNAGYHPLN